ncbi:general secretion pathway protein GspL [Noviherbaspirillum sp. 17J57-3]|uniref:General secretion pathway protein GspL n=1 Tax=Noviherbaspirillum galbum TaxID=2709383 RepID=A0A6B3SKN8_9BURK|nr:general secretion pathway protein GspL [Noviherbaspirillum galbum]
MPLYCQYALATTNGSVEREGVTSLPELGDMARRAQRVVLLLAASDVTLLRVKVPPLSPGKLRTALPNLVEDSLMADPADCVIVPGATLDGLRTVAVADRGWVELLHKSLTTLGARKVVALPAQFCLPVPDGTVTASVMEQGDDIEVALRLAPQEGIGLPILADQPETAAFEVIQAICTVVPHSPVTLYVPQSRLRDYQDSMNIVPALDERIKLHADNWPRWIDGASNAQVDLMSGLAGGASAGFDWRPWRWPLVLATLLLAINAVGLNIDWLRMRREADGLRNNMTQTYRNAFPKETVVIDPVAQLRQKIASGQRDAGQLAADDFLSMAAAVGEVMRGIAPGQTPIASLEYHERALTMKLKPNAAITEEQLRPALAARNLSLTQPNAGIFQIRSGK